jgi:hypothetical protein
MDYFEMNLNIGITFMARYSYNFAIITHIVVIFTNWKFGLNFFNIHDYQQGVHI